MPRSAGAAPPNTPLSPNLNMGSDPIFRFGVVGEEMVVEAC